MTSSLSQVKQRVILSKGNIYNCLVDEEMLKKYMEMEEQLRANAAFMSEYEKTFAEKLAEAKAQDHSVRLNSI